MKQYIYKILSEAPPDIKGVSQTHAGEHLFKVNPDCKSSRWFLLPEGQELVIQQSHIYVLIYWLVIQEHIGGITFQ